MIKAYTLCSTLDEAKEFTREVGFHQAIRTALAKSDSSHTSGKQKNLDHELRRLLSQAITSGGVEDLFKLAGIKTPDISILSEEFLQEITTTPYKHLAVEMLERLIKDEVKTRFKNNMIKQRKFSTLLQQALSRYTKRRIEATLVIDELVTLARQLKQDTAQQKRYKLNDEEGAYYDALVSVLPAAQAKSNKSASAQQTLGKKELVALARKIPQILEDHMTVDWAVREDKQANLRLQIGTLLRRHNYPPEKEKEAAILVLEQAMHIFRT